MEEAVTGMSKARALAALGLRDEDLLGAFVWGSRAFGTSTASSGTSPTDLQFIYYFFFI
jgi:hypothetical protein